MDLEIRQLSKSFHADVTFIFNLPVLLLQWVGKGFVARAVAWCWVSFGCRQA